MKSFVVMLLTLVLISGCGWMKKKPTAPGADAPVPPDLDAGPDSKKWKQYKKGQPGLIFIDRHTTEYSISMVLDASDDNIYFMMDLPEADGVEPEGDTEQEKPLEEESPEEAKDKPDQEPGIENATEASKYILYAQTYFFEKKYRRALDEIGRALKAAPDTAVAYSLKGSVHYKLGEEQQAVESWEKALELDPNLDNVKTMLSRVKAK